MNLPPFVYSLYFWEMLSFLLAGVLGLLVFFGVIPAAWALSAGVILTAFMAVLKFFKIEPQFRHFK